MAKRKKIKKGGGEFRIFENGKIFDKVGVNYSEVYGKFSKKFNNENTRCKRKNLIFGHQVYLLLCI